MTKSRGILGPRHVWTKVQLKALHTRYPHERTADLAADLGIKLALVHARANRLGIHKSEAFKVTSKSGRIFKGGMLGKASQFKPGQLSWNKGTHYQAGGRSVETQFKKLRRPSDARNYRPIGSERVCSDGYLVRKITDDRRVVSTRRWEAVHRLVWIQHKGKIPRGHAVCFKDGQVTSQSELITIDRLELVPRAELARRNRMWTVYPKPLAKAIHALGQLTRRIRDKERAHGSPD